MSPITCVHFGASQRHHSLSQSSLFPLSFKVGNFGLEEFIDALVRTYSSGMYMRLAFSVAVNVNPDILLLDEVLAVGDAHFAEKSRARMEEFKGQGKTILLVTHDLKTVRTWCHQALWLHDGRVQALGTSPAVVEQYLGTVGATADVK